MSDADEPFRPLPAVTAVTAPYWTSGRDGLLRLLRCRACGHYTHPPGPRCASCLDRDVAFEPVSGRGTVHAVTVNHQPWYPGWTLPYAVAIVRLDEQDDLQLLSNVVGCDPMAVRAGDRVQVVFEQREDVWLPLFEPAPTAGAQTGAGAAG